MLLLSVDIFVSDKNMNIYTLGRLVFHNFLIVESRYTSKLYIGLLLTSRTRVLHFVLDGPSCQEFQSVAGNSYSRLSPQSLDFLLQ